MLPRTSPGISPGTIIVLLKGIGSKTAICRPQPKETETLNCGKVTTGPEEAGHEKENDEKVR
ncbi:MAG: hypothetical protein LBQ00_09375 [Syntrophobacterales bacterium]|jgi:hypothetical protein|nr:hypothetical protein [Syntrophobacterales bacterium]